MNQFIQDGQRYRLTDPTLAPEAGSFLWNRKMMIQATCRGFATAQFMQPEPAKYSHGPTLAAKTFMQPEHPYFSHHPGRFFYVKDKQKQSIWSAPYEPTRALLDQFTFEPGLSDITWRAEREGIAIELILNLTPDDTVECWQVTVTNTTAQARELSLYPYFPVGYASWMNQSGDYNSAQQALVSRCISPYQKLEEYPKQKKLKDLTFLAASEAPTAWESRLRAFEGEGGLHCPDAIFRDTLENKAALYELPACIMQFDMALQPQESKQINFLFGPAFDETEIQNLREKHLYGSAPEATRENYRHYIENGAGNLSISSPDSEFNHFINHWLPRQLYYHGDSNRLTTDPQTRNYLQDAMGMAYLTPNHTKQALITALSQQKRSGQMPDGILLTDEAELKYINQIPHTDHGVWLILCLRAYLNETNDIAFLFHTIDFAGCTEHATVFEHICKSLDWLIRDSDDRGLSFIAQGDWCDPMNMVGPEGKGVSVWLTQALAYALTIWIPICEQVSQPKKAEHYSNRLQTLKRDVNQHCWDGDWYIRGITDQNRKFGSANDAEGRIFLNTQSWSLLAGISDKEQTQKILNSVSAQLDTPYGPMMSAPAFTHMHEDIGRVTQKFPGTAENGSVYNHAAMFWCAALFSINEVDRAFDVMRNMLSTNDNEGLTRRGQLPIYVPNYYRGAYYQHPDVAGRSSHLFNTGTAAWFYQLVVEQLCGFTGSPEGLIVQPKIPKDWPQFSAKRIYCGAKLELTVIRDGQISEDVLMCNEQKQDGFVLNQLQPDQQYKIVYRLAS